MSTPSPKQPKYSHHKATGQARVQFNGKSVYLGVYDSPESHQRYAEFIASLPTPTPEEPPKPLEPALVRVTVRSCVLLFSQHAIKYYVHPDGTPTGEHVTIRCALKPMVELFGDLPASEFGPKRLKEVRDSMISLDWSRRYINKAVNLIRRCFKWCVGEELIPGAVWEALKAVDGLKAGRTAAREKAPILLVDDSVVDAVLPRVSELVADVIRLMRLTGMRPGEAVGMKASQLDRTDPSCWIYNAKSKTAHLGKSRPVPIGPQAQEIILPRFVKAGNGKLFPITVTSLRTSVHRGCERAKVANFHPNQIRHTVGTEVRAKFGLDAAQVLLGHSRADVTQTYAERDMTKAQDVARKIG
jgi:integrase